MSSRIKKLIGRFSKGQVSDYEDKWQHQKDIKVKIKEPEIKKIIRNRNDKWKSRPHSSKWQNIPTVSCNTGSRE